MEIGSVSILQPIIGEVFQGYLRAYQLDWIEQLESNDWAAILGARQIGKDRTTSFYGVGKALLEPGSEWNTFSASAKQAERWLDDCRKAYKVIRAWAAVRGVRLPELGRDGRKNNVRVIELHNGSKISSHASSVRAAVGLRGSVLLNEIGVLSNAQDMYEALEPIVSGALDNGIPAKMMIMSNASRRGTFWHRWWTTGLSDGWAKMVTTWREAYSSIGRPKWWLDSRTKRRIKRLGLGGFSQWYECQWRAAEEGYLGLDLLDRQGYDLGSMGFSQRSEQFIGYDVGRHVDPAAWARLVISDAVNRHAMPTEAKHKMPYAAQRLYLRSLASQCRTLGAAVDSTGSGDEMAEQCQAEMPFEVVPVHFTAQSKWAMFSRLKESLENGELWIPREDFELRMELESLTAEYRPGGGVGIHIPREGGGHGDRAVALALAEYGYSLSDADYWSTDWTRAIM